MFSKKDTNKQQNKLRNERKSMKEQFNNSNNKIEILKESTRNLGNEKHHKFKKWVGPRNRLDEAENIISPHEDSIDE